MAAEGAPHPSLALRWRLTAWIALAFAVAVALVFLAVWFGVTRILEDRVVDDLNRSFQQVEGRAVVVGEGRLSEIPASYPYPVAIYDAGGRLIAANSEADVEAMSLSEQDAVQISVEGGRLEETVEIRGEHYRVRAEALRTSRTVFGIVQVGRSTQAVEDVRDRMFLTLVIGGVIALVVVGAVGYWLARGALRPVERIAHVAEDIEASDLTRRIGASGEPAEVQRLADTFDGMLERLEKAFAQQRNFVMDVSHELRTPLTGLRGNIDVMLMDQSLASDARAQLETMSQEVSRLVRLTSNLLLLAHAEAGREVASRPVELDDLCLEVVHQESNVRQDVRLRLEHEEQVTVAGDRDLLKQLLLNVVDNAVKFSPPGGEVVVSLRRSSTSVDVVIEDQGPGIPEGEREKIFERFYRSAQDGSRTVGGAGIGLAISRWIARAHGGDIRAGSGAEGGSRFTITLPVVPAAGEAATIP